MQCLFFQKQRWILEGKQLRTSSQVNLAVVCNSRSGVGTSIEDDDLTKHLNSETHQLEVSIILLLPLIWFLSIELSLTKLYLSIDVWEIS